MIQEPPQRGIPYGVIAEHFRLGEVVPFLGAAASFAGAPDATALPGGVAFANMLARKSGYPGHNDDPLTMVAQYVEDIASGRNFLLNQVGSVFYSAVAPDYECSLTRFLKTIDRRHLPKLMITTNYDVLVERTLEALKVPYTAISHVMRGNRNAGRLICYEQLGSAPTLYTRNQIDDHLADVVDADPSGDAHVFIYKMHGTSGFVVQKDAIDSIVLTETDYLDFLADEYLGKVPSRIMETLRTAHLLFLGYSLQDWNFRVLLTKLHKIQRKNNDEQAMSRHWACLRNPGDVEARFWDKRGVTLCLTDLETFLRTLGDELR